MARRQIGGDDNEFDINAYTRAYLADDRGGRDTDALMSILGLLAQREESAQSRAFKERGAEAEEMWRRGQLEQGAAQERRLTSEAERMAGERKGAVERETSQAIQTRMDKAQEQALAVQKEQAAREEKEQERKTGLFKQLVSEGAISPTIMVGEGKEQRSVSNPVYQRALERLDPGYADERQAMLAELEAVQREGQVTTEPPATTPGSGTGAAKMLLNIPTVGRNIGRYAANIGPNILRSLGMNVGTWPYEEMIDPSQFREAQAIMGNIGEAPNVVGPAPNITPRPQFGNYGPSQVEVPPYMYGVGTRR